MARRDNAAASTAAATDKPQDKPQRYPSYVTGRPRAIATPEEFVQRVDDYLAECAATDTPIMVTGLALALGFESKDTMTAYAKRPEFAGVVKRARLVVENAYEGRLNRPQGNPAGPIFALKNMGWSDRLDVAVSGVIGKLDFGRLPHAVVERIAAGDHPLAALAAYLEAGGELPPELMGGRRRLAQPAEAAEVVQVSPEPAAEAKSPPSDELGAPAEGSG